MTAHCVWLAVESLINLRYNLAQESDRIWCKGKSNVDLRNILLDIHALEEELLDFERKYGIRSETLYAAYTNGEEPEDERWVLDFGEWASIYRTWLTRQAEYRDEVQRRQRTDYSLHGLIQVAAA